MSIKADYHLHSCHSGDCNTPIEQLVLTAIDKGLTHICLTDHRELPPKEKDAYSDDAFRLNTDSYLFDIIKYKEKYADKIKVFFGVELGLQPQNCRENLKYVKSYDFDYVLISTHICNGRSIYSPGFFSNRSEDEAFKEYFDCMIENLKCFENYDVLAHLDTIATLAPNKDANYSYFKYRDQIDEILRLVLKNEKGLEVNTSGFRKGLREFNPCVDILKRYRELGGEIITIGSDAHHAEDVAADYDRTCELLKSCGFGYYAVYEGRMPEFKKL